MMAPRFKGKPNFVFSLPCPLCTYQIQPNGLIRLASHIIKCPKAAEYSMRSMAGNQSAPPEPSVNHMLSRARVASHPFESAGSHHDSIRRVNAHRAPR